MNDNSLVNQPTGYGPAGYGAAPIKKPRETKSYKTLYEGLQTRVSTALLLLASVKCEKGSQDTMNALIGLLRGNQ